MFTLTADRNDMLTSPPGQGRGWPGVFWRRVAWGFGLGVWTASLLTTYPVVVGNRLLPPEAHFPTAKTLHVGVYFLLAALLPWLRTGRAWCWLLLALLSFHGCATEFLQQWVDERTGSLRDVGFDHLGIALGLAVTWRWWPRPSGRADGPRPA